MITLIISDTHLDDKFDKRKFNFLKKIITAADHVIINGDFWDGYTTTFDKFIASPWKGLFPLFIKKKTVYVYGNHDKKEYANKGVDLFSVDQTRRYAFSSGDRKFFVEHGDRIAPLWDKYFHRTPRIAIRALEAVEYILTRNFNKKFLRLFYEKSRQKMKKFAQKTHKNTEFFVFGHIPVAEIDLKNHYINSGFCKYGIGQYIVINDGKVSAHEEWYRR